MSEVILRDRFRSGGTIFVPQPSKNFSSSPRANVTKNFSAADWRRQHV